MPVLSHIRELLSYHFLLCAISLPRALADRGGAPPKDRATENDTDEFFEAPSSDLEDSSEVYKQAALAAEEELVRVKEEREILAARLADMEKRAKNVPLSGPAKGSSSSTGSTGGLSVITSERKSVSGAPTKTSPRARVGGGMGAVSGSSSKSSSSTGGPFARR